MVISLLALTYSVINLTMTWNLTGETVFKSIMHEITRFLMANSIVGIILILNFYVIMLFKTKSVQIMAKFTCIMTTSLYFGIAECSK